MTISRQALEEALAFAAAPGFGLNHPDFWIHGPLYVDAARAILDAPPVAWCETHDDPRAVCDEVPEWKTKGEAPCQFGTYVRVKVAP